MTNNPFSRSIPETLPQVNTTRLCFGKSKLASHTCCFSASNIDQKPPSLINNFLIWRRLLQTGAGACPCERPRGLLKTSLFGQPWI